MLRPAVACLLSAVLVGGGAMTASAATWLYVSMAPEKRIQVCRVDANDGTPTKTDAVEVSGAPGSLGTDPQKRFLYASLRSDSRLAAFRIDAATGRLAPLNSVALPRGENAAYVATDRTGRWLVSASYAAGKVVVHRLNSDGSIAEPSVQTVATAKTAHCVAVSADGRWVLVPHVAPNAVFQFRLDAESGKLTDAGRAAGGSPQAGPRHLAFHPTLPLAFTSDEKGSSITAYKVDGEKGLTPVQTLSTLPSDFSGSNSTAEVKVHPSGRFVWVSNRGHDSLAGFAIAKDGTLSAIGRAPTEKTPRSFDVLPNGRVVYGAGEGSGKLAVFACDEATGELVRKQTVPFGESLTWVLAVELGK